MPESKLEERRSDPGRATSSEATAVPGKSTQVDASGVAPGAAGAVESAARSAGRPLPAPVQQKFEGSLGQGLDGVRVHDGPASQRAASAVGAKAYTVGQDIHVGKHQLDLGSKAGEHLLAHEVAHTVQQRGGAPVRQNKLEVSSPGDAAEHEADRAADAMVAGRPAGALTQAPPGAARQVMREASGEAGGGGVGGGMSSKLTVQQVPLGKAELGPIEGEAQFSADIGFSVVKASAPEDGGGAGFGPAPSGEGEGPANQVQAGPTANAPKGGVGVGAELKHEFEGQFLGFKAELAGGGELNTQRAKFGVGVSVVTKAGPIPVQLQPLEFAVVKWEKGKEPEFAVCSTSASVTIPAFNYVASDGMTYQISASPKIEFEFKPDPVKIGRWALEEAAEMLASDVVLAGGMIAAGALAIGLSLYQIAHAGEITARTDAAIGKCRNYCKAYVAAASGLAPIQGDGAAEGFAAGQQWLDQMKGKYPEGMVTEKVAQAPLYEDAWHQAWPQIKKKAIDDYWKDHWMEHALAGDEGMGNGGFHTFKDVLDTGDLP